MRFEQLKQGLFVKYENKNSFSKYMIYGRIMYLNDSFVRILNYDDFHQFEFDKTEIESMEINEIYGSELMQYLVIRKEVLTELLDEVRMKHSKEIVDINYDISKLDVCINDLKA